ESDVRLELRTIHLEIGNEPAQVCQFHFFRRVLQLFNRRNKVHPITLPSTLRSRSMQNQAVRLVTWNIEKGKRWSLLEKCLQHESIRTADVLCLNEVDEGMARSGNLRIGHEIASRLGMQVVFG